MRLLLGKASSRAKWSAAGVSWFWHGILLWCAGAAGLQGYVGSAPFRAISAPFAFGALGLLTSWAAVLGETAGEWSTGGDWRVAALGLAGALILPFAMLVFVVRGDAMVTHAVLGVVNISATFAVVRHRRWVAAGSVPRMCATTAGRVGTGLSTLLLAPLAIATIAGEEWWHLLLFPLVLPELLIAGGIVWFGLAILGAALGALIGHRQAG